MPGLSSVQRGYGVFIVHCTLGVKSGLAVTTWVVHPSFFVSFSSLKLNLLGSFDDDDGSENVTLKKSSRFFLSCCDYSNLLQMSNAD